MTTGQRIKAARKQAGMTQKALGEELGISYQTVAQWENDLRNPKQETLLKIAKALNVHLRDLVDNSWLEEIDQHLGPEKLAELQTETKDSPIEIYLRSQGFSVKSVPAKWHWENENDPPEERVQIADEWEIVISKDGHTATFTDAEFEELQAGAKEAIEGKFYKKVLEQQKK